MVEVLPIRVLTDEDSSIFGSLNVALGKLSRLGIPVAPGIVVTPPNLKLETVLENYDLSSREILEQSLTLVKKELKKIAIPDILIKEVRGHNNFFVNGKTIKSVKKLWFILLDQWINHIRDRFWNRGFYQGITEELEPQIVIFIKKVEAFGRVYFDPLQDDSVINIKKGPLREAGKLHPNDLKNLDELVILANKKLFIPHEYEWIVGGGVKLTKVLPYTPNYVSNTDPLFQTYTPGLRPQLQTGFVGTKTKSAVKVFLDLSKGIVDNVDADGIYISSEKIFDLNKPRDSFEDLVLKVVEATTTFEDSPVLFKLADKSEGMGKVRGALRLLHQQSLFDPMVDALDFLRHKRGLKNVHIVVPFVRGVNEFLQIKRELAVKKLSRKNSLELWLEIAVPENVVNLEDYLVAGLDGIVLNLDELTAYLSGFDPDHEELTFYKNEVSGLLKFLEDGIRLLHKSKIPFIAYGSLSLNPKVLEFLVEKGVYGFVIERYEASSAHDLLHQAERKMILRKAQ